ncbi:hypothetical protein Bca4012_000801 [Brassica carinata]
MVDGEIQILRGYELRLLRCTVSSPPSDSPPETHPQDSLINSLLSLIESGDYLGALGSDATKLILGDAELDLVDSVDSAERVYSELLEKVESFVVNGSSDGIDKARRAVMVMCLAIAAAFWFTRCNLTGPTDGSTKCSLPFKVSEKSKELVEWENWAKIQLMSAGSDLLGKFSNLQRLVFARMLLLKLKDLYATETFELRSVSWWIVRVLLIHQRVLHERSSSLFDMLQVYIAEALDHFGDLQKVEPYWDDKLLEGEVSSITSTIHLEAFVLQYIYGRVDPCRLQLESAKAASKLELSVSGAFGFRTIHQVEPKAQMVLIANTSSSNGDVRLASERADVGSYYEAWGGEAPEVYMTPKLVNDESEAGKDSVTLKPVEQAMVLAQCLLIEKGSRSDEMQSKEYGELLVSCGLVGEAITIFESLELWDSLIHCYCFLGKKSAAVDLINAQLLERPNDPRLWCSLGDVTNNDSCYEKALEVSNDKSVRAKRALARSAYNRGDFEKSQMLWEAAMALNSLYPDGWFALGAAALKARDVQKAIDAFTFAVQLDPDNGEAWNNIACLRDSWQMWENFSHVAMDVGNIDQTFEAIQQILRMSKNKRIDVVLLDRIMTELENRNSACKSSSSSVESVETEPCAATPAETQRHLELLGKIIQQATVSFPESEELKELESCLEEVINVMQKGEETKNTKT